MASGYYDFSGAFGNLNSSIDGLRKRWDQNEQKRTLAELGQQVQAGNFDGAAQKAFALGDAGTGLGILKLGQAAKEKAETRGTLMQWGGAGSPAGQPAGSPSVAPASLVQNESGGNSIASAPFTSEAQSNGLHVTSAYRGPDHPLTRANPNSPHAQGMAWDLRARTPEEADNTIAKQRDLLTARGLVEGRDYRIIDEVRNPTRHATGPHIHVQLTPEGKARHGVASAQQAPVQVAQAPGGPLADAAAPGAANAQGYFIPPGQGAEASVTNDKNVQLWQQRYMQASAAGNERLMKVAEMRLGMATKDAERRYAEGKAPEAVREWQWARQNGLTTAKSPVAYAKEKAEATRQDSAPTVRQLKQADGSEVAVQWNAETKTWDPLAAPKGGEAVRPTGTKLTEGQSKDLIYHSRGLQALEAFEPLAGAYADGAQRLASAVPGGNYVVTEEFQMAKQAGRNFLASVLRKDTGAAVTPSEEVLYGDIFLPQPGDKPGTLAQKSEARKQAIDAIRGGMGTAEVLALGKRLTTRQPGQDAPEKPLASPKSPVRIQNGMTPEMIKQRFAPGTKLILPDGTDGVVK